MAHNYIASPRTDAGDQSRFDSNADLVDFSIEASFFPPEGRDDLFKKMRGERNQTMATPRQPLAARRNPNAKTEFTPLLKSAAANRTKKMNGLLPNGKLTTPLGLRNDFKLGATPLPEGTILDTMNSSSITPLMRRVCYTNRSLRFITWSVLSGQPCSLWSAA